MSPVMLAVTVLAGALVCGFSAVLVFRRRSAAHQNALEVERMKVDAVLQTSLDGIALFDADGALIKSNSVYSALKLPVTPGSPAAEGRDLRDHQGEAIPGDNWPIARVNRGETFFHWEVQLVSQESIGARGVLLSGAPISSGPGGRMGGVLVARELSAVRSTPRQTRRANELQAIGLVAAGIAHDFNNTLTVVLGNASLLREAAERHQELLHEVLGLTTAARQASTLTRRLLALTRRESPGFARLRPGALVVDLAPTLRRLLPSGATLATIDKTGDADEVLCDPRSLELAIVGLIGAARPSMSKGGAWRLVCDAGTFPDAGSLAHKRLVRVTLEGPARMLEAESAGLWQLVTDLPPDIPGPGIQSAYRCVQLPGDRSEVQLLLSSVTETHPPLGGSGG
jgi:His Kinase A (phospho-acceptor) domain